MPVRDETKRVEFENAVLNDQLTLTLASGDTLKLLERPATIETNMSSRPVTITLPLSDTVVPSDIVERQKFENNLYVYIEHSDGEREILKGKIVSYDDSGLLGVEFHINKFSTFAVISLGNEFISFTLDQINGVTNIDILNGEITLHVRKGIDLSKAIAKFTLTEGAIATVSGVVQLSGVTENDFTNGLVYEITSSDGTLKKWTIRVIYDYDQSGTHKAYINGYVDGTFKPFNYVTRAELASIINNLMNVDSIVTETNLYSDVKFTHWASNAIGYVREVGLMNGYNDGTFRPDQYITNTELRYVLGKWLNNGFIIPPLEGKYTTRYDLIKIVNLYFDRGPLFGLERPSWSDVPLNSDYSGDIEEASKNHDYDRNDKGAEHLIQLEQ